MPRWAKGLIALLLLAAAGGVLMLFDRSSPTAPLVAFRDRATSEEARRTEARRTYSPPVAPTAPSPRPLDPFTLALPRSDSGATLVIEVNALRHSPLGEYLVDCLLKKLGRRELDEFRQKLGVDPLEEIDRIGISGQNLVVSGFFGNLKTDELPEGAHLWNQQLLILGKDEEGQAATLARLEGRLPPGEPALSEETRYGELYGSLGPAVLAPFLAGREEDAFARLLARVREVKVHLDASESLALTLRAEGDESEELHELGRSINGVISLARTRAVAQGEGRLASLLDQASVSHENGAFTLRLALNRETLQTWLGPCEAEPTRNEPEDETDDVQETVP